MRIDQTDNHLVVVICGKAKIRIETTRNRCSVKIKRPPEFGPCARIVSNGIPARERRKPLAEAVRRRKTVPTAFRFHQRYFVVPSPEIRPRRGKPGAPPPRLE